MKREPEKKELRRILHPMVIAIFYLHWAADQLIEKGLIPEAEELVAMANKIEENKEIIKSKLQDGNRSKPLNQI